jgi:hypothetical protein
MKLPQFQQGGKPPVKRKVRCRLNLARIARAGNEALASNLTEPKANLLDRAVLRFRAFTLGDPVRLPSPWSTNVFHGEVISRDDQKLTILWESQWTGTFEMHRTHGWDLLEKAEDRRCSS